MTEPKCICCNGTRLDYHGVMEGYPPNECEVCADGYPKLIEKERVIYVSPEGHVFKAITWEET